MVDACANNTIMNLPGIVQLKNETLYWGRIKEKESTHWYISDTPDSSWGHTVITNENSRYTGLHGAIRTFLEFAPKMDRLDHYRRQRNLLKTDSRFSGMWLPDTAAKDDAIIDQLETNFYGKS
jgi:hypothetical protein